jgi:hypothetical protein
MKAPPAAATDGAATAAGNKSDMADIADTGATNRS